MNFIALLQLESYPLSRSGRLPNERNQSAILVVGSVGPSGPVRSESHPLAVDATELALFQRWPGANPVRCSIRGRVRTVHALCELVRHSEKTRRDNGELGNGWRRKIVIEATTAVNRNVGEHCLTGLQDDRNPPAAGYGNEMVRIPNGILNEGQTCSKTPLSSSCREMVCVPAVCPVSDQSYPKKKGNPKGRPETSRIRTEAEG